MQKGNWYYNTGNVRIKLDNLFWNTYTDGNENRNQYVIQFKGQNLIGRTLDEVVEVLKEVIFKKDNFDKIK